MRAHSTVTHFNSVIKQIFKNSLYLVLHHRFHSKFVFGLDHAARDYYRFYTRRVPIIWTDKFKFKPPNHQSLHT